MRRFLGTAVFFVCAVLSYQSYQTSRPDPTVQELSRKTACGGSVGKACAITPERMKSVETSSFGHRYAWMTKGGDVWVNCRREWIVFGAWGCEVG